MPGSRKEVEIVVVAQDRASGVLKGIGSTLSTAIGTFAGGAALNLATAGVEKLFGAISGGISDARDAAQVFAQTEAVIKSTGGAAGFTADEIADMAGSLSAASGKSLFGDDDIQRGQNMLLTFTNITDQLPDTTQVMLDMAQALGTDAGGAAVQLGKALNDPINGISALSRVGVSFTEQQKEQIKTMQEAGDISGAQAVILAELNKEFGGSALAAAEADGGMAQFNDRMGELAESLGGALLPLLNQMLDWLNSDGVQNGIQAVADGISSIINAVGLLVTGDFSGGIFGLSEDDPWIDALFTAREWIVALADELKGTFAAAWPVVQQAVDTAYQFLSGTVWPFLQTAFGWVTDTGLPAVQRAFEIVWPLIQDAVNTVYAFFRTVVFPWMEQTFNNVRNTILPSLRAAFEEVWPKIKAAVEAVYTWLHDTFFPWLQNTAFRWLAEVGLPALQTAFETVWPLIESAVRTVYVFLRDQVWPWLSTNIPKVATWIQDMQGKWNTAWAAISNAVTTAKNTISTVIATIKSLIDGAITRINDLIRAINSVPGIEIPTIPSAPPRSGNSGFNLTGDGMSLSGGGTPVVINQTFAPGTGQEIRDLARAGAIDGYRAAARAQGLI